VKVPCPVGNYCSGYSYETSNGNNTYESVQGQLQRRFRSGFSGNLTYSLTKAIDDAIGAGNAQNWLDLSAERGPTSGVRTQTLGGQMQYSTGVGNRGGGLVNGWKGFLLKDWTVTTNIQVGSGLPINITAGRLLTGGTAVSGNVRAYYTGAPVFVNGLLNSAAFVLPPTGQYGNLGRDAIYGPYLFSMSASASRTFRLADRKNLTFNLNASNPLNHPVVNSWYTTVGTSQFGLISNYANMRSVSANLRINF